MVFVVIYYFTLIELVIVLAVICILALLIIPKYLGYTEQATITEIKTTIKTIEDASELYYVDNQDWPRASDTPYTAEELESFAQEIMNKTGAVVTLDPEGNYYPIDYNALNNYIQKPSDGVQYILQNPVGEVFYLTDLTDKGKETLNSQPSESNNDLENKVFNYTGSYQTFTASSTGIYQLEVWGAQGSGTLGGKGGYPIESGTHITSTMSVPGGGGGGGGYYGGGGGGAGSIVASTYNYYGYAGSAGSLGQGGKGGIPSSYAIISAHATWYGGGGGGSSYIGGVENGIMTAGNSTMPSIIGSTETGHFGTGYARITLVN